MAIQDTNSGLIAAQVARVLEDRNADGAYVPTVETLRSRLASMESETWEPRYSTWRHGGSYVDNVFHAGGGIGCIASARHTASKKHESACFDLGKFGTRDAAARAERDFAVAVTRGVLAALEAPAPVDYDTLLTAFYAAREALHAASIRRIASLIPAGDHLIVGIEDDMGTGASYLAVKGCSWGDSEDWDDVYVVQETLVNMDIHDHLNAERVLESYIDGDPRAGLQYVIESSNGGE